MLVVREQARVRPYTQAILEAMGEAIDVERERVRQASTISPARAARRRTSWTGSPCRRAGSGPARGSSWRRSAGALPFEVGSPLVHPLVWRTRARSPARARPRPRDRVRRARPSRPRRGRRARWPRPTARPSLAEGERARRPLRRRWAWIPRAPTCRCGRRSRCSCEAPSVASPRSPRAPWRPSTAPASRCAPRSPLPGGPDATLAWRRRGPGAPGAGRRRPGRCPPARAGEVEIVTRGPGARRGRGRTAFVDVDPRALASDRSAPQSRAARTARRGARRAPGGGVPCSSSPRSVCCADLAVLAGRAATVGRNLPSGRPWLEQGMEDRILGEALTFDDVLLVPSRSAVLPSRSRRAHAFLPPRASERAHRLRRDGHRDRERDGHLASRDSAASASFTRTCSPDGSGPAGHAREAQRERRHRRPRHAAAGRPHQRGPRVDGGAPDLRHPDRRRTTTASSASSPTATCASSSTISRCREVMTSEDLVTAPPDTDLQTRAEDPPARQGREAAPRRRRPHPARASSPSATSTTCCAIPAANLDLKGRLVAGAAVGVFDDERVEAIVDAHVDVVVVDTAHGHTRERDRTPSSATRRPTRTSTSSPATSPRPRPRATRRGRRRRRQGRHRARLHLHDARRRRRGRAAAHRGRRRGRGARGLRRPVIADGGIRFSGDIVKALAAGRPLRDARHPAWPASRRAPAR